MSFEYQNELNEDADSNWQTWLNGDVYQLHQSQSPHVQNLNLSMAGSSSMINVENGNFTGASPNTLQNEIPNEFLQDEPNNMLGFLNYGLDDHNNFTYAELDNLFSNQFFNVNYGDIINNSFTEPADKEDVTINILCETTNEDVFTTNQFHEAAQTENDESSFTLPFNYGLNMVQEKNDSRIDSHDITDIPEEENIHFCFSSEIANEVTIETDQPEDETWENNLKFGTFTIEPIQETPFPTEPKMYEVILIPEVNDEDALVDSEEHKIQESFESNYVAIEPKKEVVYVTDHKPEEDFGKTAVVNVNRDISNLLINCPYDKCKKTFTGLSKFKIHMRSHNENRKFKCPISNCAKSFNQKVNLNNHIRTHTGSKPFKCSYCNKSFTQQGNMKTHERKHASSNSGLENCQFCEEKFCNRNDLHKHLLNHKPLKCLDCEDQFERALDLHAHIENVHDHKTGIYHFCFRCNLMFNDEECLSKHNHEKHLQVNDIDECIECKELFSNRKELIDHVTRRHHNGESFLCRYCKLEKPFVDVHSLIDHVNDEHKKEKPHRCDLCGERFHQDFQLIRHSKLHETVSFECPTCHHLFSQKGNLETHKRLHTGQKPFKCEEPNCGKSFSDSSTFIRHKRVHTKEKPYQCEFCLQWFSQLSNVKCHKIRRHKMLKTLYECDFCVMPFDDKNELENHNKQHTGDRPYLCRVCLKTFKQWAHLKTHLTTTHPNKSVSHICEYCDRTFESQTELQEHKNGHIGQENPYVCNVCQKTYGNSTNLKKHFKLHTCEKSHVCGTCGKKFFALSILKIHELSHQVERPYKCTQCNKSFTTKYRLKSHVMVHTGEKPHSCLICSQKFRTTTLLKRHITSHNENTLITSAKGSESFKKNTEKEYHARANSLIPNEQPDELISPCKLGNLFFETLEEKNDHQINHNCNDDDDEDDDYLNPRDHIRSGYVDEDNDYLNPRENLLLNSKESETCEDCLITFETKRDFKEHLIQCVPLKENCHEYTVDGEALDISLGQLTEQCFLEKNGNETIIIGIEDVKREPLADVN